MRRAEQITDRCTHHGEGVFWDADRQRVLLVDLLAGAVVEIGDVATRRHELGGVAAVLRRRASGGYVLAAEHAFRMLDDDLVPTGEDVPVLDDPGVRLNEGGVDPQGRLHVGSMAYDVADGAGTVFRLDPDGSVSTGIEGATIPNGLQWSDDGETAYWVDTPTDRVWAFDFDGATGTFSDRRPFIDLGDYAGHPDGMARDVEGGLWVAMYGGWAVRRFDAAGRLTEVVELPARDVTCPAFGGPGLDQLYISTSRDGWGDAHAEPEAGAVFRYDAGVAGAPQPFFAG